MIVSSPLDSEIPKKKLPNESLIIKRTTKSSAIDSENTAYAPNAISQTPENNDANSAMLLARNKTSLIEPAVGMKSIDLSRNTNLKPQMRINS